MTRRGHKTETKLQQWLNQFSERVDYGRFQRGMSLYNDRRVQSFQVYPNHFDCVIEGVQKTYEVRGFFKLKDGIPTSDDYELKCTCPDGDTICKHGVCATMYFILNELSSEQEDSDDRIRNVRETQIEEPLRKLETKVETQKDSILGLHKYRGSRVIENQDFLESVHTRIRGVMDELKKIQ